MTRNPDRRIDLADAGLRVLAESGGRGLSHRAVDRAAGVSLGTTSNYFGTRRDLVRALSQRFYDRLAPQSDPLATATPDSATLAAYVRDIWARVSAEPQLTIALLELRLEAARDPAVAEDLRATLQRSFREDVDFNARRGLPGGAREILLLHLAMDGLFLDQLTVSLGLEPADVTGVIDDLVERIVGER